MEKSGNLISTPGKNVVIFTRFLYVAKNEKVVKIANFTF